MNGLFTAAASCLLALAFWRWEQDEQSIANIFQIRRNIITRSFVSKDVCLKDHRFSVEIRKEGQWTNVCLMNKITDQPRYFKLNYQGFFTRIHWVLFRD